MKHYNEKENERWRSEFPPDHSDVLDGNGDIEDHLDYLNRIEGIKDEMEDIK